MPTPCPPHLNGGASDLTASVRSVTWSSSDTEQQLASMAARDAGVPTEDQADRTHQINDAFRSNIAILDMYPSSTWSLEEARVVRAKCSPFGDTLKSVSRGHGAVERWPTSIMSTACSRWCSSPGSQGTTRPGSLSGIRSAGRRADSRPEN